MVYNVPPASAGGGWWNTDWQYRESITINHTKVSADLTNFPVLIDITDSGVASHAQSNGDDIAFTDYDGNKLNHEIESYDSSAPHLVSWVNVPSLSSTTDTILYMYYGNPSANNQENRTGVWDSNFLMVQHLNNYTGTVQDSTSNHNDGTAYGSMNRNVVGKIDGCYDFDGVNDGVNLGNNTSISPRERITFEAWIKPDSLPSSTYWNLLIKGTSDPVPYQFYIAQTTGYFGFYNGSLPAVDSGVAVVPTVWQHIAVSVNNPSSTAVLYMNGNPVATRTRTIGYRDDGGPAQLGAFTPQGNYFNGMMDEVRLSAVARSAAWLVTEYANQNSPSGFYVVGGEESSSGAPITFNPSPLDNAVNVPLTTPQLSFTLYDYQNDLMNYWVTTSPNIGSASASGVGNGVYYVSITGLSYSTTYTWDVNVSDGANWSNKTYHFTTKGAISISLESPADGIATIDNRPDFRFTATHQNVSILSCTLWLEISGGAATAYVTNNTVPSGTSTTLTPTLPLANGLYSWWITSTDGSSTGTSDERTITINVFRGLRTYTTSWDGSTGYYWLDMPDNFDNSTPTPLVFYLHGYGQNENAYWQEFPALRQIYQQNGWIVACPRGRVENGYYTFYNNKGRSDITDIINFLENEFNIDKNHVHLHGRSMGGTGSLQYTRFFATTIASICDIHGISNFTQFYLETPNPTYQNAIAQAFGGTPAQVPQVYANESALGNEYYYRNTPVMILHGTLDEQVPVSQSRNLNKSLSELGYTVKYIEVAGAPHNPPTLVYGREQEIFDWFKYHPLDLGNPKITLNAPTDNYWSITYPATITFNCTARSTSSDPELLNMSLYMTDLNNQNFSLKQTTNVSGTTNTTAWTITLNEGVYTWNCRAFDRAGLSGWGVNRTITLGPDTMPPTWDFPPANKTIPVGNSFSYDVNASDNIAVDEYFIDDNVNFTINAFTGLISNKTILSAGSYKLNIGVNDTSGNVNSAAITVTVLGPAGWWDNNWQFRKQITIDHSKVAANLVDFPVLIDLSDADLASKSKPNGDDIVFIDYYGTKLNHEIEMYESATGHLVAWVTVPSLSSTTDTRLYMYYANPSAANQQNRTGVWDLNYAMVQHFEESSGTVYDSTAHHNDGTPYGGINPTAVGKIDGAYNFDGVNDYLVCGNDSSLAITDRITFEAWIKPDSLPTAQYWSLFIKGLLEPNLPYQFYIEQNTGVFGFYNGVVPPVGITSGITIIPNAWQHIACSVDSSTNTVRFYFNGNLMTTKLGSLGIDNGSIAKLGGFPPQGNYFDGIIDELRISRFVRSSEWLITEYASQNNPAGFYTVGGEQSSTGAPYISNPSPRDKAVNVPITNSRLNFTLTDFEDHSMNYTVTTSPNIGSGTGTNVANGAYTVSVSGLLSNKKYTWQVNVTDGTTWTNATYTFTTESGPGGWWDNSWQYRKKLTINHNSVVGNLTNFPVLIKLVDADLRIKAKSNGDDIVFTDYYGTKLNHEIEYFSASTGELAAWVKTPNLSSVADTILFMYYGNPSATSQQNITGVWDSNYLMVHHLSETSGTHYDSTSNDHDGTTIGTVNQNATGKIDGADSFAKPEQYVQGASFNWGDAYTFSSWLKADILPQWSCAFETGVDTTNRVYLWTGNNQLYLTHDARVYTTNANLVVGNWYYVEFTFNYSALPQVRMYINGNPVSLSINSGLGHTPSFSGYWRISRETSQTPDYTFTGTIDEVRVSNTARSADWMSTEYNNQMNPSTFLTVGNEETQTYTMTVSTVGQGFVSLNATGPYGYGEVVQCAAVPNSGYRLDYWLLDSLNVGSSISYIVTMDADHDLTAFFVPKSRIYIDPPLTEKTTSEVYGTFRVNVTIEDIQDLWGFDFNVTWDDGLVKLSTVDFSTALDNMWGPGNWYIVYEATGAGYYDLAALTTSGGFSGSVPTSLATLEFHIENVLGETPIHIALVKLSNSTSQPIPTRQTDGTYRFLGPVYRPSIVMTPATVTCRKNSERFDVQINVTNAIRAQSFNFTIYFNASLLNYAGVAWGQLGIGTITTVDQVNGILKGNVAGQATSGDLWLLNVTFSVEQTIIWYDGATNNLQGRIWLHSAVLDFSGGSQLQREEGGIDQINLNEASYSFVPIQGDIDNNGVVDIGDLRTVAYYYDVKEGDPLWAAASKYDLNRDLTIDLFDPVVVGANFGFMY